MKPAEAAELVRRLAAAFPTVRVNTDTVALYTAELAELRDDVALRLVVAAAIKNGARFPTLSVLRSDYLEAVRRRQEEAARHRGLPEPDPHGPERARTALAALARAADSGPMYQLVRERLSAIAGGQALDELAGVGDEGEPLPLEPAGRCDDCGDEERVRYRHGRFVLCRGCFDDRRRVAVALRPKPGAPAA